MLRYDDVTMKWREWILAVDRWVTGYSTFSVGKSARILIRPWTSFVYFAITRCLKGRPSMVLKQSWNKWTKFANCLFLISPTRTHTICLFTIYESNVTFTHLETWKCVYNLIRDVSNHPASFSRLERDNVNTDFKWNPAIWTWKNSVKLLLYFKPHHKGVFGSLSHWEI